MSLTVVVAVHVAGDNALSLLPSPAHCLLAPALAPALRPHRHDVGVVGEVIRSRRVLLLAEFSARQRRVQLLSIWVETILAAKLNLVLYVMLKEAGNSALKLEVKVLDDNFSFTSKFIYKFS